MALIKPIRQDDGVTTSYHRILYIQNTINKRISIAVLSYIDAESRENEKQTEVSMPPYCKSVTYETEYNPNMTIEDAYAYLKTKPRFENADDDI